MSERALYEKLYSSSQESVFLIGVEDSKIIFANPRAVQDTGFERTELLGLPFEEFFLPTERTAIQTMLESTVKWSSGSDPRRLLKRKSGKKIIVEMTASMVEFESKPTVYCSVRDITARVKAEEKILEYSQQLEKINAELEERVRARTSELATAMDHLSAQKKELDDVMSNIEQGILTIGPDLKLNSEFSAISRDIFGKDEIAGADAGHFFLSTEPKRRESMSEWLGFCFRAPEHWEMSGPLALKELEYSSPKNPDQKKILELSWKPIFETGSDALKMAKMLVICIDVTEQRRLERAIADKEEQHQEELELIGNMILLPTEVVGRFSNDFREGVKRFQSRLTEVGSVSALSEDDRLTFARFLHTIKGNARQMRLNSLEKEVHELEGVFGNAASESDLVVRVERLGRSSERVFSVCERVLNQLGNMNSENSSTDSLSVISRGIAPRIQELMDKMISGPGSYPLLASRQVAEWLSLVPSSLLFRRIDGLVSELSNSLGRPITFETSGGDVRIESEMLNRLHDVLLHLVRNSADHGAQPPEERKAQGKPEALGIRLSVRSLEGSRIEVLLEDDGKGIDSDALRKKIVSKQLLSQDEVSKRSDSDLLDFIFLPGFSTRDEVTELSGRGVGMDVVHDTVMRELGGEIKLGSVFGKGASTRIELPLRTSLPQPVPAFVSAASMDGKVDWDRLLGTAIQNQLSEESKPWFCEATYYSTLGTQERQGPWIVVGEMAPAEIAGFLDSNSELRHYADLRNRYVGTFLRATRSKLSAPAPFGMESYLWSSAQIQSHTVKSYSEKSALIEKTTAFFSKFRLHSSVFTSIATIADEMIMNACFDAPRNPDGSAKYNHLDRTEALNLGPSEFGRFRFGIDPNFIALSIEDPFGALDLPTLKRHIAKGFRKGGDQISRGLGGAGMGLFMIFENAHFLVVNRIPGKKTEMIALIGLGKNNRDHQTAGRGFSFFEL